jgi:hypothetical protein
VLRLAVPPTLARTLRSTNSIESMISISRAHACNVKHWQSGNMALRWCAAGMAEAGKASAASTGTCTWLLFGALDEHVAAETVGASVMMNLSSPPDDHDRRRKSTTNGTSSRQATSASPRVAWRCRRLSRLCFRQA